MAPMKHRLLQDRLMRDAARQVVTTDVELLKAGVEKKPVASRAAETGGHWLKTIGAEAADLASEHRGKLAGGVTLAAAALALWIYRDELGEVIAGMLDHDEKSPSEPSWLPDIFKQD
ncbi:hypothetical protein M3P36_08785 [Altererythrobacter sp. KTW20L]|uniref:hypothetical protein n=1 Tax=Altererythrobacter sp. KTW20L TaxID=2942210 RepID=UPI0020BE69CA|nr:hypothetical protein [Altererythrobacter sp. KTW20L]MCL6251136.1 hypothetical protein [Altererythrobacter sp. KTW20L]